VSRGRYVSLLLVVLSLSITAAAYTAWQRIGIERDNKSVEVAVQYSQVWEIAKRENMDLEDLLRKFKAAGVTSLLIKEQLAEDLETQGLVYAVSGMELIASGNFDRFSDSIKSDYTYFVTARPEVFKRLKAHLEAKLGKIEVFSEGERGLFFVGTPFTAKNLSAGGIGLGFPEEGLEAAQKAGLNIIPQVRSWPEVKEPEALRVVFRQLYGISNISALAFCDPELPGFPHLFPELQEEVEKLGAPIALIEFFPQKGLSKLALVLEKKAVRLHSIGSDEMLNMSPDRALDRYILAASERNVRVLFVRCFQQVGSPDWLGENLTFINKLKNELEAEGFVLGRAHPFNDFPASRVNFALIGLGVIAGGMLLLEQINYRRIAVPLGVLGLIFWAALLLLDFNLARKIMALSAVVIFPTLAVVSTVERVGKGPGRCVLKLAEAALISLSGALMVVGLMTGTQFMLKLDQFAGVKVGILTPLVLIPSFLVIKYGEGGFVKNLRSFLESFVEYKWLFVFGLLGLIGIVLVIRSGNEVGFVTDLEIRFRALLSDVLLVRPRTKEFLLGHPFMILSYYLGYRHKFIPLVLLGSIGQVSIVNTFEHLHTPLIVSVIRTFNGIWIGILMGIVLILGYEILRKAGERLLDA